MAAPAAGAAEKPSTATPIAPPMIVVSRLICHPLVVVSPAAGYPGEVRLVKAEVPSNGGLSVAPDRSGDPGSVLDVAPVLVAERVVAAPGDRVAAAEQLAQRRAQPG